jgi:hypothetical protein
MGIPTRRLALEHIDCNVSLEIYNDTCLCLQCNDCDVIIMNFGPSKIIDEDDPHPLPACAIGILVAMSSIGPSEDARASPSNELPTPALDTDSVCEEIAVMDDFNQKFYESDNGQISEGEENDEVRDTNGTGRNYYQKGKSDEFSERTANDIGGTCYFGKPADDPDSGSPSQSDDSE